MDPHNRPFWSVRASHSARGSTIQSWAAHLGWRRRTRTVRRRVGDAVQQDYARGGGSSGADPAVGGIVTVSAATVCAGAESGQANPSACGASSAITQDVDATHAVCEGFEHGSCSGDACSAPDVVRPSDIGDEAIPGIAAIDSGCARDPPMDAIPGAVHTTPSVTIVR